MTLEELILRTPTGEFRNRLTNINIIIMAINDDSIPIKEVEKMVMDIIAPNFEPTLATQFLKTLLQD